MLGASRGPEGESDPDSAAEEPPGTRGSGVELGETSGPSEVVGVLVCSHDYVGVCAHACMCSHVHLCMALGVRASWTNWLEGRDLVAFGLRR